MKKHLLPAFAGALIVVGLYLFVGGPLSKQNSVSELPVSSHELVYHQTTKGWYAEPEGEGNYPGVVMVHEWWGLNEHIKEKAEELAGHGYRVLAVDLHGSIATTREEAMALVGALNQEEALANMKAATAFLTQEGAEKIAALGWCFGGGQALQFSLAGEELDATVVYYGTLVTDPARLSAIEWPVLGVFGSADQSISTTTVATFERALDQVGVENEIYMYEGVGHAFANPTGNNYAPEETADAWEKTLAFLNRTLK
ncbi:dienelactone hydrolase family protein [Patescibacteria group bacterium]|nr:dienelactone hydrolase family protein [Patescibacteria group bacterium]